MYIFIVLLSAIFLGLYEVLKKKSLQKSSVYEVLFFYCLSGFLVSLIFANNAFSVSFNDILFILLKSIIIVVNWWLVLICMEKLDVGIIVPFSFVGTILVVFASGLIFKEQITYIHFLSLLFIGIGVILTALLDRKQVEKKDEKKKHHVYILLMLFTSVLSASTALLDKYLLNVRNVNNYAFLIWFMFFTSIIYGIFYLFKNRKIEWKNVKKNYWMIFTGAAIVFADITYYQAITMDGAQISLISILRKFSVIVATILASLFLKEKNLLKKLGILCIMIIGVALPIIFK